MGPFRVLCFSGYISESLIQNCVSKANVLALSTKYPDSISTVHRYLINSPEIWRHLANDNWSTSAINEYSCFLYIGHPASVVRHRSLHEWNLPEVRESTQCPGSQRQTREGRQREHPRNSYLDRCNTLQSTNSKLLVILKIEELLSIIFSRIKIYFSVTRPTFSIRTISIVFCMFPRKSHAIFRFHASPNLLIPCES